LIKIIYRDLSPGLHASADTVGRDTIISLLPGLTSEQRRAALRRIRHSGRMGHGPHVSALGLALALGLDRIKAVIRTGAAVVRLHPAGSALPVLLLSTAAVVFVLMATVSIHVVPGPQSSNQNPATAGSSSGSGSSAPHTGQNAPGTGVAGGLPRTGIPVPSTQPSAPRDPGGARSQPGHSTPGGSTPGGSQVGSLTGRTGSGAGAIGSGGTTAGTGSVDPVGTGTTSGSSGLRTSGSGTSAGTTNSGSGTGSSGSGSGFPAAPSGSGGTWTPAGSGTTSTGTGGTGSSGFDGSGAGSTSSSGTGSVGSSGSSGSGGGLCVTLLSVQACLGL
jgi:hypothetical protein